MNLLIFILVGFGITSIITQGRIFEPFRNYFDNGMDSLQYNFYGLLLQCPLCVGFWTGLFLSFTLFSPTDYFVYIDENISSAKYVSELILSPFFDAVLLSGIVWTIHSILSLFDRLYTFTENVEKYKVAELQFLELKNMELLSEPIKKTILSE